MLSYVSYFRLILRPCIASVTVSQLFQCVFKLVLKWTTRNSGLRSVLEKRWVLSVPKPRFRVDTARGIYVVSDGEFWSRFCMSVFAWTWWRILIKILPVFHVETIRKVYHVSIYFVITTRLQTIKKEAQLHRTIAHNTSHTSLIATSKSRLKSYKVLKLETSAYYSTYGDNQTFQPWVEIFFWYMFWSSNGSFVYFFSIFEISSFADS